MNSTSSITEQKRSNMKRTISAFFQADDSAAEPKSLRRTFSIRSSDKSSVSNMRHSVRKEAKATSKTLTTRARKPVPIPRVAPRGKLFGWELSTLMKTQRKLAATQSEGKLSRMVVPISINKMLEHVRDRGLAVEGMFRIAACKGDTDLLKHELDNGMAVNLYKASVENVGDLIKSFLRELPTSLLAHCGWAQFIACAVAGNEAETARRVNPLLHAMPVDHQALATVLFDVLRQIHCSRAQSRMDAENLARVMAPNLLQAKTPEQQLRGLEPITFVMKSMISHFAEAFGDMSKQYLLVRTINVSRARFAPVEVSRPASQPLSPIAPEKAAALKSRVQTPIAPKKRQVLERAGSVPTLSQAEEASEGIKRSSTVASLLGLENSENVTPSTQPLVAPVA